MLIQAFSRISDRRTFEVTKERRNHMDRYYRTVTDAVLGPVVATVADTASPDYCQVCRDVTDGVNRYRAGENHDGA